MTSELSIKRVLDERTKTHSVVVGGKTYALHMRQEEVILTEADDYDKVVAVFALDFFKNAAKKPN